MSSKKLILSLFGLSILLFASRILPHSANWGPALAICVFSGYLSRGKGYGFLFPAMAWLAADLVIGLYPSLLFQYIAILLSVVLGVSMQKTLGQEQRTLRFVSLMGGSGMASALSFFLLSNLGVWAIDALYPKTWQGLMQSYVMGLPFFKASLVSTSFWMLVFAMTYQALVSFYPKALSEKA